MNRFALGIDIGGSGTKGAPVDVLSGSLTQPRTKVATPQPSTPEAVAEAVAEVAATFDVSGTVGVAFPGVVRGGVTLTAANLDDAWIGLDAEALISDALDGRAVRMLNDADAAGIAEMTFGAGSSVDGVVVVATLGTGIGSALFTRGVLVPNTEFGHLSMRGGPAEHYAAANVRKNEGLSWKEWARRLDEYLVVLDALVNPELIVLGGGVSRKAENWLEHVTSPRAKVVAAALRNEAGIIGAAMAASDASR